MKTLGTAWAIACKDLRVYFRDRTGVALGFLLPLILVTVFGFMNRLIAGGDGGSAFSRATVWVADADQSEQSRTFVAALRGAQTVNVQPDQNEKPVDAAALRTKLEDGEIHHALLIESGFGTALTKGELPTLRMLREWRERTAALSKFFTAGVRQLFVEHEATVEADAKPAAENHARNATAAGSAAPPGFSINDFMRQIVPIEREDFRPPERPKQLSYMLAHTVSGIAVMMLMFGLVACAGQLLRERESGTLVRLLLSPADRDAIVLGKFLFALIVGAGQLVLLFAFGSIVFKVDVLRDAPTFLVITLAVLLAVTAFGMLIGTWAKTQKQADGVSTLAILVMSAVGGAWFPLQMLDLPPAAKVVMQCTLTHWAVSAYQGLFWYGRSLGHPEMLRCLEVLLGFAVVASCLARWLFTRRYVGR